MSQGFKSHARGWPSPHWLAKDEKNLKDKQKIRETSKLLHGSWFESEPSQTGSVLSGRHYSGKQWEPFGDGVCLAKGH